MLACLNPERENDESHNVQDAGTTPALISYNAMQS